MHWYDKCEFEVDAKEESRAGGMTLRVRLVKTKKGRAGTAPVDSVVGECAVKVKPLQGKTRRAQWQWHTFNTGNQQQVRISFSFHYGP